MSVLNLERAFKTAKYQRSVLQMPFTFLIFSKIIPTEAGHTNGLASRGGKVYFAWI